MDEDGNKNYRVGSPACGDSTWSKRACNTRTTGDGHATIATSTLTNKPLFWHDQMSCVHCQNEMSKHLESGKCADEISVDEFKPCYRSTNENPDTA